MSSLIADQIVKKYDSGFILGPVSFNIAAGECVAIMGKNGAGKTTMFQIATGNLDATDGSLKIDDQLMSPDAHHLKRELGYLPQHLDLPRWVTAREVLNYGAKLYNLNNAKERVKAALDYWDCEFFADRPLASCSHGMQKRVGLALANLNEPSVLILDEPFSGLDIYHTKALEDCLKNRSENAKASIVCTHIAPYAAKICSRALGMDNGKLEEFSDWPSQDFVSRIELTEHFFFGES